MSWRIVLGDVRERLAELPDRSVQCCVTSPPYWGLRDYGTATWDGGDADCAHQKKPGGTGGDPKYGANKGCAGGAPTPMGTVCIYCGARRIDNQIGLEATPDAYVAQMVQVFAQVKRVLKDDGTLFLNLGDSYATGAGSVGNSPGGGAQGEAWKERGQMTSPNRMPIAGLKPKDLCGIPWRVAFALQSDGWYLRSDIIWCLSGGAKVYARTQKGDMPTTIKDLVRLDPATVQLWNGEKWTQVLGWSQSPEPRDGALEIELRSGERIGCTPNHEWPTQRGNVRADALAVGDVIQTTRLPEPERPVHPAGLVGVDDDVAWLCGLYLAEGSMSADTVQLAGHANQAEARLARLERIAQSFHGTARAHISENRSTINLNGPVIQAVVRAYIHGDTAKNKGIKVRAWQRDDAFLRALLQGYLDGDGHHDVENDRWRLGFTRNDRLAGDLRTLAARLGLPIRLAPCTVTGFGREWPAYRGDIRLTRTDHRNARKDGEVVSIGSSRAREFWDIGVADEPHLFALASGVLTHNSKPNPMPESVTDRPTKAHEYIFLLTKSARYYYDSEAIAEPVSDTAGAEAWRRIFDPTKQTKESALAAAGIKGGNDGARDRHAETRNCRTVWDIATQPYPEAHFATFPEAIPERCIKAGSKVGDTVLDPFCGAGTTGLVADRLERDFIGIELNPVYRELARKRIGEVTPLFPSEQSA